ncbi:MAG TPA: sugar-binding domain-containing protein, partial [Rectinemataceae bacterium]|nr:sugar-binding domain-containing protein [Rectinemataceae bacterium]
VLATSKDSGIAHATLYGTLMRLSGADASVYPNFGGRFSFTKEECVGIARATGEPLGPLKQAFPAPGGGMTPERTAEMLEVYGRISYSSSAPACTGTDLISPRTRGNCFACWKHCEEDDNDMNGSTEEQLLIAVNLYYMENMTQEEIASKLGLSRVAVTRMLKKARDEGMVQITVKKPMPELYRLALDLEKRYRLKAAIVAPGGDSPKASMEAVGRAGAELLERLITTGCRIGVAWSATVSAMLPYVRKPPVKPGWINELAGTYLTTNIPYVVSWPLAEKLGVPVESIPMPVLVRSGRVKEMMIQEPAISSALESASKVDLAFVGLGNVSRDSSIMRTGYIGEDQLEEFSAKGAVGDILMRYY